MTSKKGIKKSTWILLSSGLLIASLMTVAGLGYVSYSNAEIALRNSITASQKVSAATFDAVWKILHQQAQVADKYRDGFKDIYSGIMSERYSKGDGSLMKWITEANPNFDVKLYDRLTSSIEEQRTVFLNQQVKLIDLKREHDNLLGTFPGSLFLAARRPVDIQLVTSSRTEKAFETGKDDDIKL